MRLTNTCARTLFCECRDWNVIVPQFPKDWIEVSPRVTCTAGGNPREKDWTGMCLLYVQDANASNEASCLECIASWLGGVTGLVMR